MVGKRHLIAARMFAALLFAFLTWASPSPAAQVFVDAAGRSVELPDRIDKVAAAGPPAAVLVYCLAPGKLVGWVREPSAAAKAFLLPETHGLPVLGQLTGKGGTANLETLMALKPDLIVDAGTVNPTYAALADKVQAQTGIPYILIDGAFEKTPETLESLGAILGVQDRARQLADDARSSLARVTNIRKTVDPATAPRVYFARGPQGLETGMKGSINTAIIEFVGARNAAADAGEGGLANVSLEQILAWAPDVIVAMDRKFAEAVKIDPGWASVPAVRTGRVYVAPSLPWGWVDSPPGINRLAGLPWLLSALYPGAAKLDLKDETRRFYRTFYQVDVDDAQLETLLGSSK